MNKIDSISNRSAKPKAKTFLSPILPKYSPFDFNYRPKQDPLWGKDQSYFRRKLNEGLEYEQQYITKTGLTSSVYNNPESPHRTLDRSDFYRRDQYSSARKEPAPVTRHFDVLNNPKMTFSGRNEDKYFEKMGNQTSPNKGSETSFRKTLTHLMRFQPEVTSKIGATSSRDYTIPRPQLKVGKNDCVDTYSPF